LLLSDSFPLISSFFLRNASLSVLAATLLSATHAL
jgi:hypothetical protein